MENKSFNFLKKRVIDNGFCVGCGACAAICKHNYLSISFNSLGQNQPFIVSNNTCFNCGLCIKVCPFYNENNNEDTIGSIKYSDICSNRNTEVGFYHSSFVGFADDKTRLNGASGGALTQLLKYLIVSKIVDKILTVKKTNNPNRLFEYVIINSVDEIDKCSKSAYYPVEVSQVVKLISNAKSGRFAIVGLPCILKAVENLKGINSTINNRIVLSIGLVCGQLPSKKYAEYFIHNSNVSLSDVKEISFREKQKGYDASNFFLQIIKKNNEKINRKWKDDVSKIWLNSLYKQKSCFHCDDVFAECADVVFMDAWLPEYIKDYKGTSLIVLRNSKIISFFEENNYSTIDIDKIIESQKWVLISKRDYQKYYDEIALESSDYIPKKRKFEPYSILKKEDIIKIKRKYKWAYTSLRINFDKICTILDEIDKYEKKNKNIFLKVIRKILFFI